MTFSAPPGAAQRINDGTNLVLQGSSSAANLSAATQVNAALVAGPGQWSVTHAPAANTVATISKAAGSAGQRHVITGLSFIVSSGTTAPAALAVTVNLRDGATGAGTILKTWTLVIPASVGVSQGVARNGLNIVGTAATAMTLEFTAAGGANTFESVEFEGYTVV